jgi:hypothetical protein
MSCNLPYIEMYVSITEEISENSVKSDDNPVETQMDILLIEEWRLLGCYAV